MSHLFQAFNAFVRKHGLESLRETFALRLSYHVMFADTTLHDAGKKTVRDFILG